MSEIIKERVKDSIGKYAKVFLINGWRYAGKLTNYDDDYLEILDDKTKSYKIIRFLEIKDCEVEE